MSIRIPTESRKECFRLIDESDNNSVIVSFLLFLLEDYLIPLFCNVDGYHLSVCPSLPYNKPYISYFISPYADAEISIEIETNNEYSQTLLQVLVSENSRCLYIPKIMVHESMRHKGIGKEMIKICFKVAQHFGYRLLLVQMVDSFLHRMLKRGAKQVEYDVVEITESTDLSLHYS